jgi:hypothetical protein
MRSFPAEKPQQGNERISPVFKIENTALGEILQAPVKTQKECRVFQKTRL